MRVLLVEDDADLAKQLQKGFREQGFSVDCAGTFATGLMHALSGVYDVMIIDRMLPGGDALDMLAGDEAGFWRLRTPKLPIAVNGAGDLFAALFFHHWLKRRATDEALSLAASSVHAIVKATETAGSRELVLLAAQDELVRPSRLFTAEAV